MSSSGRLRRVAFVKTDVSEERIASIVLLLVFTAHVIHCSSIFVTLMMEAIHSTETSVLTRAARRNIPEGGIPCSHRRENQNSYTSFSPVSFLLCWNLAHSLFFHHLQNKQTNKQTNN
jgi:hypothetical protein